MSDVNAPVWIEKGDQRVRVEVDGVTVADSAAPMLLHEPGLPVRYYLPPSDVRTELLEPTDSSTHCPLKGDAEYFSVRVGDQRHPDIVWSYPSPITETEEIAGLLAFYDEKVDVYVDEVLQERPKTKFG